MKTLNLNSLTDNESSASNALLKTAARIARKRLAMLILTPTLLVLIVASSWYLVTGKPLSQLPGLFQAKLPHYVASFYGVTRPMGVAVNPAGDRIYVTESGGTGLVQIFDRSGAKIGLLAPPKSTGPTHVPFYVAVDPLTGDVYVSDRPAQAIYIYSAQGAYVGSFTPIGNLGGGWQPIGLAFDKQGNFYVSDVSGPAHRILVFNRARTLVRTLETSNPLTFPNGIAIDSGGKTYVGDSNNGRVVTFDLDGKLVVVITRGVGEGELSMPRGMSIDSDNRLYISDTAAHIIKVYQLEVGNSSLPKYIGSFGEEGQLDGAFAFPNGLTTDSRSRIYITDRENNRLQVWSY